MAKIERLAKMKEEGILTEEEFQQQKKFILNG
ncbi:SHOCT domain-containing protein [Lacticaseibacillus paracasei]